MKEIYIIRHGETDFNKQHIIQGGGVDTSLNETGLAQGRAFYEAYKHIPFEIAISSDLKRSIETIQDFYSNIPHEIDPNIREMNWGIFEGKSTSTWMKAKYGYMLTEWDQDNLDARLEEGESAQELIDRLNLFIQKLIGRSEKRILVCTHGRTLRALISMLDGNHPREMEKVEHHNTGLYLINLDGNNFSILERNNTNHL